MCSCPEIPPLQASRQADPKFLYQKHPQPFPESLPDGAFPFQTLFFPFIGRENFQFPFPCYTPGIRHTGAGRCSLPESFWHIFRPAWAGNHTARPVEGHRFTRQFGSSSGVSLAGEGTCILLAAEVFSLDMPKN